METTAIHIPPRFGTTVPAARCGTVPWLGTAPPHARVSAGLWFVVLSVNNTGGFSASVIGLRSGSLKSEPEVERQRRVHVHGFRAEWVLKHES